MRISHNAKQQMIGLLLWFTMATTMLTISSHAFTKVGMASAAEVCEETSETLASEESESSSESSTSTSTGRVRAPPRILANGSFHDLENLASFESVTTLSYDTLLDGKHRSSSSSSSNTSTTTQINVNVNGNSNSNPSTIAAIPGGEPIELRYVRDLLSPQTAAALIESCDKRSGWTTSPQSVGGAAKVAATRTSRSCPLIWPQLYLPLLDDPAYKDRIAASGLTDEIDLTWRLTQRVAQLLDVGEEFVEPFQLVRYQPGEFYKEHHDHGSYYGVDTEQRPLTLLVFLSDLPSKNDGDDSANANANGNGNSGGYTKFRALGDDKDGVAVVPRLGDGVLWKNEDADGNLLLDAIHEAIPPEDQEGIIKYAMNVWIAKKKIKDNMDVSAYRTQ